MPGPKNPGIFYYRGNNMLQRVISYTDGRVVYYYDDKEVTYRKNQEPEVVDKTYNKKGIYGFLEWATTVRSDSPGFSRY